MSNKLTWRLEQRICRSDVPLRTTGIRTDDDTVLNVQVLTDPPERARFGVQIVYRNVEESLDLAGMQIHGDDMVTSGSLQHVGHQFCCDRSSRFVFLVLASVREVGNHSSDSACRSRFTRVNHDQQLHQRIVDITRRS